MLLGRIHEAFTDAGELVTRLDSWDHLQNKNVCHSAIGSTRGNGLTHVCVYAPQMRNKSFANPLGDEVNGDDDEELGQNEEESH